MTQLYQVQRTDDQRVAYYDFGAVGAPNLWAEISWRKQGSPRRDTDVSWEWAWDHEFTKYMLSAVKSMSSGEYIGKILYEKNGWGDMKPEYAVIVELPT